jgi:hypothetical protein
MCLGLVLLVVATFTGRPQSVANTYLVAAVAGGPIIGLLMLLVEDRSGEGD